MAYLTNIFAWEFENIPPGGTQAARRVDADRVMDNYNSIVAMVGFGEIQGANCVEGNATNGASTVTVCNITMNTDQNVEAGLTQNDYVQIKHTSGAYWMLQSTLPSNELSFDAGDLWKGSTPGDYSAIKDGLTIQIVNFEGGVGKNRIPRTGSHADILTLADLEIGAGATPTDIAGTVLSETEVTVDEVTTGGVGSKVIAADVVIASSLKKSGTNAVMAADNPDNLVKDGRAEHFIYREDIPYGFDETAAPANDYWDETTVVKHGSHSAGFATNGGQQGLQIAFANHVDITLLQGKKATIVAWVRSTRADALEMGFYDDDEGAQVTTLDYEADTWGKDGLPIAITVPIGVAATEAYGLIQSADGVAANHYVDFVAIYIGETAYEVTASVNSIIVDHALGNKVYNFIPMSNLEDGAWLNGGNAPPLGWGGNGATQKVGGGAGGYAGNNGWRITLDVGEYFEHYIGIADRVNPLSITSEFRDKPGTFSFWMGKYGANTEDLDLIIEEHDGSSWSIVASGSFEVNDYDDWGQVAVTGAIAEDTEKLRLTVKNNGSAQLAAVISSLMFTATAHPIAYTSLTPWQYVKFEFGMAGALADGLMLCQGITGEIPVGINCVAYGMTVSEQTSGSGTDSFYPRVGAVDETDLQVDLGNGDDYESVHYATGVYISVGNTLGVYCDADGGPPGVTGDSAFAVVHCLVWGI